MKNNFKSNVGANALDKSSPARQKRLTFVAVALLFPAPFFFDASAAQTTTQPLFGKELNATFNEEETRRALDQIEFQFSRVKASGVELADELAPLLQPLLDETERRIAASTQSPKTNERAQALLEQIKEFQRLLESERTFFETLERFDEAATDADATRAFFAQFSNKNPEINPNAPAQAPEIAERRRDLLRVATSLDALRTVDDWNAFVEERGSALERFYVDPETASETLRFLSENKSRQGFPLDADAFERRVPEWKFAAENRVPIRRKILLALENELRFKYWTFAATPDEIYYLKQPPRPGRNVFVANAQGTLANVEIPADAPETKTAKQAQTLFLQELASLARQTPETLRDEDVGRWYVAWSNFLKRLQTATELDPIVRFQLLRSSATTLASGDFYFARRLAPILRTLDVPQLEPDAGVDRFDAQSIKTKELRRLARTRFDFLPNDYLTVDKTTTQLDAQVERIAFVYRRVGWLDRDFSGAWRRRNANDLELPVGDLYILRADENASGDAPNSNAKPRFSWLKIGYSDGRQTTIEFAATNVWRGSIIFCRTRLDAERPVAERREFDRFFRR